MLSKQDAVVKLYKSVTFGSTFYSLKLINELIAEDKLSVCDKSQLLLGLFDKHEGAIAKYLRRRNVELHNYNDDSSMAEKSEICSFSIEYLTTVKATYEETAYFVRESTLPMTTYRFKLVDLIEYRTEEILTPFVLADVPDSTEEPSFLFFRGIANREIKYSRFLTCKSDHVLKIKQINNGQAYSHLCGFLMADTFIVEVAKTKVFTGQQDYSIDFTDYQQIKCKNFEGRVELIEKLHEWFTDYTNKSFYVAGPPGIGKTAIALKFISKSTVPQNDHILAVHFVQYGKIQTCSTSLILKSFVSQVCQQLSWKQPDMSVSDQQLMGWLGEQADQLIKVDGRRITFLIDGFDELPMNEMGILDLYMRNWMDNGIRLIVFSRQIAQLEGMVPDILLAYDDKMNRRDILESARRRLVELNLNEDELDSVVRRIANKVNGQFVYLDILCRGLSLRRYTMNDIDEFPLDLDDFYSETMKRLQGRFETRSMFIETAIPVLGLFSVYAEALDIQLASQILLGEKKEVRLVIESCRELLNCVMEGDKEQFILCHKTIRDFLIKYKYVADDIPSVHRLIIDYYIKRPDNPYFKQYALQHATESRILDNVIHLFSSSDYLKLVNKLTELRKSNFAQKN